MVTMINIRVGPMELNRETNSIGIEEFIVKILLLSEIHTTERLSTFLIPVDLHIRLLFCFSTVLR